MLNDVVSILESQRGRAGVAWSIFRWFAAGALLGLLLAVVVFVMFGAQ